MIGFIGASLLVILLIDVCWTAVGLMGGGPVSALIARSAWKAARALPLSHRARAFVGAAILMLLVAVWSSLLWVAWFCIFAAGEGAVVEAKSGRAATLSETFYFAGYTVFTLGNGDFAPRAYPWTVLTAVAAGTGLIVITLAITYLIAVLAAVVEKRTLAASLADLGGTPDAIVRGGWTGNDFQPLQQYLPQLATTLNLYVQHHLAYPVLHYFHGEERRVAAPLQVAALHEALLVLSNGVDRAKRIHPLYTQPLRKAIGSFASLARKEFVRDTAEPPTMPDLAPISAAGIPIAPSAEFEEALAAERETRAVLRRIIEDDAREWEEVWRVPDQESH